MSVRVCGKTARLVNLSLLFHFFLYFEIEQILQQMELSIDMIVNESCCLYASRSIELLFNVLIIKETDA